MSKPEPQPEGTPDRPAGTEPASPEEKDEVSALRSRLAEAEQAREQYLSLAMQKQADFENYQRRVQRDLAQERRYAHSGLARDLLPVLDNLERALTAAREAGDQGPLAQGVSMVYSQVLDVLRAHGITQIQAQGQTFDPNLHEAVTRRETAEYPPSTVADVLEQGYLIHDRVLRPSRVAVAMPPAESKQA